MTRGKRDLVARMRRPRALWRQWRDDRSGATLIQFVAVLPLLVIIIFGLYSLFLVYSAHQTVCEAVWSATRYLQVEGPYFEEDVTYPDGWIPVAVDIINTELKSNAMSDMQVEPGDVLIHPPGARIPPVDQSEVVGSVPNVRFFVRATVDIPNPLAYFFDGGGEDGQLQITCQKVAYYETEPLKSTDLARPPVEQCPLPAPKCTPGPRPTDYIGPPPAPTQDPCPCDPN